MAKLAPLLFVVAGLVIAAIMLFDGEGLNDASYDDTDPLEEEEHAAKLRTSEAARAAVEAEARAEKERAEAAKHPAEPPRGATLFIKGIVVDDATGKPIVGARLHANMSIDPCPRLSLEMGGAIGLWHSIGSTPMTNRRGGAGATTGADGRFVWMVGDPRMLASSHDVFTSATGYITGVLCQPTVGSDVTIRLKAAIKLEVTVTDPHGRPIEAAYIMLRPGPDTPSVPGHAGFGTSDENGRGTIDGLKPGLIVLHVDHPAWMPASTEAFDPALEEHKEVRLTPALLLSLKLRSDDGSAIKTPSLGWKTDGTPGAEGLLLLRITPGGTAGEPNAEVMADAVRIPCADRHVRLEVKAEGFEAWKQQEPLPADGGTREVIAILTRDTSLGGLEILFQGPDGKPLPYTKLGDTSPAITHLGGVDVGALTFEVGETLLFKSLPAGRYLIGKRSSQYAPGEMEVEVRAGERTKATMKMRACAKLRVRFTASEARRVRFRLLRGGQVLPAFPASAVGEAGGASGTPLTAAGTEGALFTGLPAGTVTIEVTSPDLSAAPRSVQLQEGETTEVEIEVRER